MKNIIKSVGMKFIILSWDTLLQQLYKSSKFNSKKYLAPLCNSTFAITYQKQSPPLFWIFVWHFWKATYRQYLLLDHENDSQNVPQKLFREIQLQTRPVLELGWSTCHLRFFSWLLDRMIYLKLKNKSPYFRGIWKL